MVKILAHRGASKERPENTMSAFKRAAEVGADGIELDVHLLCDGSLVVHHDSKLGRCENVKGNIYDFSKENIKSFSVGDWFSRKYEKEFIPYFIEVLEFLKGNNLFLNVEIKSDGIFMNNIADEVVSLLEKYNMINRCIISSFNHFILKEIKEKYPRYRVGILYSDSFCYDVVDYCKAHKFDAIHPNFREVDKNLVKLCHANGILVNVWTVDSYGDFLRMKEYGVDTVITNDVTNFKPIQKYTI
ncbi:MAG: glpQ [Clostridiales bacterium]|jgi:glycerophosphoryl diester phosphodiesterase|nr:glpQ [Clostridiales bacterium]